MHIIVKVLQQVLTLHKDGEVLKEYSISTAKKGLGEERGSYQTPRGWHQIRAKIGKDLPSNAILVGRRFTGEIYTSELAKRYPERDWILTRILWLSGLEPGINRFGHLDTMRRYIYIHGCPDTCPMGIPLSHGCIRMRNQDVVELFDLVNSGTRILITA